MVRSHASLPSRLVVSAVAFLFVLPPAFNASPALASPRSCRWSIVPSPSPGTISNMLFSVESAAATDVWSFGSQISDPGGVFTPRPLALHWDGAAWTEVGTPGTFHGNLVGSVALSPSEVWAVGSVTFGLTESLPLVEAWDGTAWSVVSSPAVRFGNLLDVGGLSPTDLWAVGTIRDRFPRMLIEHFDGARWTVVPGPRIDSAFVALGAVWPVGPDDVWAVGSYLGDDGLDKPLAVHFDGSTWSLVDLPALPDGSGALDDVEAAGPEAVWMVGHTADGLTNRTLALRWTPAGWTVAATLDPGVDDRFDGLSIDGGRVTAVGSATDARGTIRTLVEVAQGDTWRVVRTPNPPGASTARLWDVAGASGGPMWAIGDFNPGTVQKTLTLSC